MQSAHREWRLTLPLRTLGILARCWRARPELDHNPVPCSECLP